MTTPSEDYFDERIVEEAEKIFDVLKTDVAKWNIGRHLLEAVAAKRAAYPGDRPKPKSSAYYMEAEARRLGIGHYGEKKNEAVDHPAHYNEHPSGVECIDVIEWFSHNVGAAVKYLWRAGLKAGNPTLQDLRKARWYIEREIARIERSGTE